MHLLRSHPQPLRAPIGGLLPHLLGSFLVTACNLPGAELPLPDAGAPSGDLALPSLATVSGTRVKSHVVDPNKLIRLPVDLSSATLEALVPDTSGSAFTAVPGTGRSDGSFSIPGVALSAPYYLHYYNSADSSSHQYIHTSAATLDLGEYSGQRSGVVRGASGTSLTWDGVGVLDAWGASDQLLYYSSDNGLYLYGSTPLPGASALKLTQSFVNQPLLSSARADTLYVLQLHQTALLGTEVIQAVSKALVLSALDVTDAISTTVSSTEASFSTPVMQSATFDFRRSQFAALQSDAVPAANQSATVNYQLYVSAIPGGAGLTYGFYTNSADLLAFNSSVTSDVALGPLSFGNPFPPSYGLFVDARAVFTVSYSIPGATAGVNLSASIVHDAPLATFTGDPIAPKLGPVSNLQINGQNAYITTAPVGTQPVLSWSPPRLGSANSYLVAVHHLAVLAGSTRTSQTLLGQIYTTQTRIVLPPGLLKSGEYYVFRVVSYASPSYDLSRPYYRTSFPAESAATLTTMVTP